MQHLRSSTSSRFHVPVTPLINRLNAWGMVDVIQYTDGAGFNPSLISLPSEGYSNGPLVVVAREHDPSLWEDDPTVRPRWLIASMLTLPEKGRSRLRWDPVFEFKVHASRPERLPTLVNDHTVELFPKCGEEKDIDKWFRNVQGPEDPRLFWTHLGEPLLLYNSFAAENIVLCRQMWMVDLRSVFPPAAELLSTVSHPAPIRFSENFPLTYSQQSSFQKNWAPFTDSDGEIYFHKDLIPQTIYKLKSEPATGYATASSPATELFNLDLVVSSSIENNCIVMATDQPRNPDGRPRIHQSTPFLELVLCNFEETTSGKCDPKDPRNRLYVGLIHLRHPYRHYERRIVTLNSTYPWNYVSVSKPLLYLGIGQDQLIYTVSMNFRKSKQRIISGGEFARGFLDDSLVISFGWGDSSSHLVDVRVEDILKDHIICNDIMKE